MADPTPTRNVRRNQSLAHAMALVGSIVATRRGKYLTRNRGLKPTAKFIRPLRGGRNRAEVKSFDDKMSDPAAPPIRPERHVVILPVRTIEIRYRMKGNRQSIFIRLWVN